MVNFDYMTPTRLIFGKDSIAKMPEVMKQFGSKILLTYGGGSIKKMGLYDKVKELLAGCDIIELSGIQPNPKYDPSVLEGVRPSDWRQALSSCCRTAASSTPSPTRRGPGRQALTTPRQACSRQEAATPCASPPRAGRHPDGPGQGPVARAGLSRPGAAPARRHRPSPPSVLL